MRANRNSTGRAQKRIRVAAVTLVALLLGAAILFAQHIEQQRLQRPAVWDYLLDQGMQLPNDPLGIVDVKIQDVTTGDVSIDNALANCVIPENASEQTETSAALRLTLGLQLTCTGVSDNARIIGYSIDAPLEQAVCEFDNRVRHLGWYRQGESYQGVCTYRNQDMGSSQYALVIYSEGNNGTSIVMELM